MTPEELAQQGRQTAPDPVDCTHTNKRDQMTTGTYLVSCPALNETEVVWDYDRAVDVCYSMHEESGAFAWVEDYLGHTVVEYGDA